MCVVDGAQGGASLAPVGMYAPAMPALGREVLFRSGGAALSNISMASVRFIQVCRRMAFVSGSFLQVCSDDDDERTMRGAAEQAGRHSSLIVRDRSARRTGAPLGFAVVRQIRIFE